MKTIGIVGKAGAFMSRIEILGFKSKQFSWQDLRDEEIVGIDAVLFFPNSEDLNAWRMPSLEESRAILKLAHAGVGIFTECLNTYGWELRDNIGSGCFQEPRTIWRERAFFEYEGEGPFTDFDKGDIFDCTGATYINGRSSQWPVLTVANINGLYSTNESEGDAPSRNPSAVRVLFKFRDLNERRQMTANIDISNCYEKDFLPRQRWNALMDRIILYVVDEAVEKAVSPKKRWGVSKVSDRKRVYETAVKNNVEWIKKLLPEADGSAGVYEGYDTYGHVMWNYRAECQVETALMLHHSGEYFNDESLKKIADNIINFTINSGIQITDESAADYGLWHFYRQTRQNSKFMYTDTAARTALGLFHFYKSNGNEKYLHHAKITLDALMKLPNKNGILPDVCSRKNNIVKGGLHTVEEIINYAEGLKHGTPHHHSSSVSSFVMGYKITGNEAYLNFAEKIQKAMDTGFPDNFDDHFVGRFTIGRYLLGLSALMETPLKEQFLPAAKKGIKYLLPLQHKTGAFVSGVYGDISGNAFETGIICSNDDEITDNLYTNNYIGVALQMLSPEDIGFDAKVSEKLLDFQASIHDICKTGDLNGGWTRAFNLRTGDPFAFNGDIGWGPNCMLTGWTNSVISLSLLMNLSGKKIIL
jgi:hypothetical protein